MADQEQPSAVSPAPPAKEVCAICGAALWPGTVVVLTSPAKIPLGGGAFAASSVRICTSHLMHRELYALLPPSVRQAAVAETWRDVEQWIRLRNGVAPIDQRLPAVRKKLNHRGTEITEKNGRAWKSLSALCVSVVNFLLRSIVAKRKEVVPMPCQRDS